MKILKTLIIFLIVPLAFITLNCNNNMEKNSSSNIHHSAFFRLKDSLNNADKELFFAEINKLADIEGVIDFKVVNETSPKNHYTNGVTMQFADQKAYDAYNSNPQHQKFVQEIWMKMVEDFMEIDYVQENQK
jgi:quinol monooxygenase YgiN